MRLLSLLALVTLLASACSDAPRSVPLVAGSIDTFDDGNAVNVYDHPWDSVADGAGTRAELEIAPGGFDPSSQGYLLISGVRPPEGGNAAVVGVRSEITEQPPIADPSRRSFPRDVTGFEGLAIAVKGTPGTYIIQLGSARVDDFDHFNAYVEVTEQWSEYRLPFSAFNQEGFGERRNWTGEDLVHIAVYANLNGYFEFSIDDVRFF